MTDLSLDPALDNQLNIICLLFSSKNSLPNSVNILLGQPVDTTSIHFTSLTYFTETYTSIYILRDWLPRLLVADKQSRHCQNNIVLVDWFGK